MRSKYLDRTAFFMLCAFFASMAVEALVLSNIPSSVKLLDITYGIITKISTTQGSSYIISPGVFLIIAIIIYRYTRMGSNALKILALSLFFSVIGIAYGFFVFNAISFNNGEVVNIRTGVLELSYNYWNGEKVLRRSLVSPNLLYTFSVAFLILSRSQV